MMKKVLLLLTVLMLSFSISSQAAQKREPTRGDSKPRAECRLISKSSAMRAASSRTDGKVLSAYLSGGNPPSYRVKTISKSGRVRSIRINACR